MLRQILIAAPLLAASALGHAQPNPTTQGTTSALDILRNRPRRVQFDDSGQMRATPPPGQPAATMDFPAEPGNPMPQAQPAGPVGTPGTLPDWVETEDGPERGERPGFVRGVIRSIPLLGPRIAGRNEDDEDDERRPAPCSLRSEQPEDNQGTPPDLFPPPPRGGIATDEEGTTAPYSTAQDGPVRIPSTARSYVPRANEDEAAGTRPGFMIDSGEPAPMRITPPIAPRPSFVDEVPAPAENESAKISEPETRSDDQLPREDVPARSDAAPRSDALPVLAGTAADAAKTTLTETAIRPETSDIAATATVTADTPDTTAPPTAAASAAPEIIEDRLALPQPEHEPDSLSRDEFTAAIYLARAGKTEIAANQFREFAASHPGSPLAARALYLAATIDTNAMRAADSADLLKRNHGSSPWAARLGDRAAAAPTPPPPSAGSAEMSPAQLQDEIRRIERMLASAPVGPQTLRQRLDLARLYLRADMPGRALDMLKSATADAAGKPEEPEVIDMTAEAQIASGNPDAAIEGLNRIISSFPTYPDLLKVRLNMGLVSEATGNYERAMAEYRAILATGADTTEGSIAATRLGDLQRLSQ